MIKVYIDSLAFRIAITKNNIINSSTSYASLNFRGGISCRNSTTGGNGKHVCTGRRISALCCSHINGLGEADSSISRRDYFFSTTFCRSIHSKDRDCHCQNHRQCTQAADRLL